MINVVAFRRGPTSKVAAPAAGETGRILLFTGVRYIRDETETPIGAAELRMAAPAPSIGVETQTGRLQA